ncbi:MAG: hypothetical protein IT244_07405 [Bacteroidia bacterium]|nr:hypothetical protein [Bacteroidia bacterium]
MAIRRIIWGFTIVTAMLGLGSCKKEEATKKTQAQYNDYDIQNGFGFKLAAANKEGNHLVVGTDFNTGALTYILTDANGKAIKKQETALYSGQGSFSVGASGNDFYVLTSNFHGQFGSSSEYLTKINQNGVMGWTKIFGDTGKNLSYARMCTGADGNIVLASMLFEGPDRFLSIRKVDTDGNQMWRLLINANNQAEISDIIEMTGEGYVVFCKDNSGTQTCFKISKNGKFEYSKIASIAGSINSAAIAKDGGFMCVGIAFAGDMLLTKFTKDLEVEWTQMVGKPEETEYGFSIMPSDDGNYYITGYGNGTRTRSFDIVLMKVDEKGQGIFYRAFGELDADFGFQLMYNKHRDIVLTGLRNRVVDGQMRNAVYNILLDKDGNFK